MGYPVLGSVRYAVLCTGISRTAHGANACLDSRYPRCFHVGPHIAKQRKRYLRTVRCLATTVSERTKERWPGRRP